MKFRLLTIALTATCISGICLNDAEAWGTRAQRAIAAMAIQKIQDDFPNTFSPENANYLHDVLRGSVDGPTALAGDIPLGTDAETIAAVDSEIQILRDARKLGPTSYFAYRMGVLSALVSNVILPYGFAWTPEDKALQAKIISDIDERIDVRYRSGLLFPKRDPIYEAQDYFKRHRLFRQGNREIIRDDYSRGFGYKGLLLKGGPAYFDRAVNAVTDAWTAVLIATPLPHELPTSRPILSWYFVNEINYLLDTRKNYFQASRVYDNFNRLGADQPDGYEKIGDAFYAFSTVASVERGVREWTAAYTIDGANRARIAGKLQEHFLAKGIIFLERGIDKDLADQSGTDLPNALTAFEEALKYDPHSDTLALYIQETRIAIMERLDRFNSNIGFIANGESVREEAGKARNIEENYGRAIILYRQAIVFFEAIDTEFENLATQATDALGKINRDIHAVVNDVIDDATGTMDNAVQAEANNQYDEAIRLYEMVIPIVSAIPEDINTSITDNKNEVIATAEKKVQEAKINQVRWQTQQEQIQAGQQPQG